ncbi:hypothetical protein Q7P35_005354 [Cladosporium inversicolor]
MAPKEKGEAQTFSFDEVACMIAAMNTAGILDGNRTISRFEHKFRAVKARGKELATELNDGAAVQKTPISATKKAATSTGKKRNKEDVEADDDDDKEPSEDASDHGADGFGLNGNHFDNAIGSQ